MNTQTRTYGASPRRAPCAFLVAAFLAASVFLFTACQKQAENKQPENLAPISASPGETPAPALAKKEEQPPFVKVRRDKEGNYSWEITGRDVDRILKTDRSLKRSLGGGRKTTGE